ncbi:hypothetical protein KP509_14G086200 [Ceratopteris richardii]|uniref:Uncharacterized protein n=1 Tax=Ceratopteris richardii TaxID=49495 RepID=A0A8T2T9Z6_CERRI|nr:hypothetical protein KP509_14G086200 [Ceratopteris richardii]
MQTLRQHVGPGRDAQTIMSAHEHKLQYSFFNLRHGSVRLKQKGSIVLHASLGETVEDKDMDSSKEKEPSEKNDQLDSSKSTSAAGNPFVGAKISSQIAARANNMALANGKASTTSPTGYRRPDSQSPTNLNVSSSKGAASFSPRPLGSPNPIPKPLGMQTFSPKPLSTQGTSTSSPAAGTERLKGARPSVFLDSKTVGNFKEPGPKGLLDTLRQSEDKSTKFGQPFVPKNLFDEPEKLTAEDKKRFDFSFNAGQLILVFSFLTIIGVMLSTAFLVWKVGAIHYNEF